MPWLEATCPRCALPQPQGTLCGACLRHPPAFDATVALLRYAFPADALLRHYKYQGQLAIAQLFGELLAERAADAARPDCLIPMPLHPLRLKERGFNQSLELARLVAQRLDLALLPQGCARTRHTTPQAGLPLAQRKRNLRGAFACRADIGGAHVAIVDDVMTSGASLQELAQTLKRAGAARVDCWVVARASLE